MFTSLSQECYKRGLAKLQTIVNIWIDKRYRDGIKYIGKIYLSFTWFE